MTTTENQWSAAKKGGIVFLIVFLWLKMFPFPIIILEIPLLKDLFEYIVMPLDFLTEWTGKSMFSIENFQKPEESGSGDTTFQYIKLLTQFVIALTTCIIFHFIKANQEYFKKAYQFIIIYARYYVGLYLLIYGFTKLFGGQFTPPELFRLEQSYGDSSPMGILWTFMGSSKAYTILSGLFEIIPGYLLLFRRTKVLGALISIIVMLNIVFLNFCYDVPVKLFSSELLFISIVIVYPNLIAFWKLFINNESVKLIREELLLPKKWMRISRIVFKVMIILIIPIFNYMEVLEHTEEEKNEKITGAYNTEYFIKNNDTITDSSKWDKILLHEGYEYARVHTNNKKQHFNMNYDDSRQVITLTSNKDTTDITQFKYKELDDKKVLLTSIKNTDEFKIEFTKKTNKDYLLINRGFHWINEYPFNR